MPALLLPLLLPSFSSPSACLQTVCRVLNSLSNRVGKCSTGCPTREAQHPLGTHLDSAAFLDPAQTVLSSLSTPSKFPTRAPLLVSLYATPSRHPLDTFLCHSPLSGPFPIEFYTQQWLLEISVQGEFGFLCTTEAGVFFYSPLSLSRLFFLLLILCGPLFALLLANCLLFCRQMRVQAGQPQRRIWSRSKGRRGS